MDASHEERKRWSSLESREPELNQAIVDVSREDFLVGNFDLKSLFSLSVGGFYSDGNREFTRQRGEFHYRLGGGSRKDAVDQHHLSLAHG